MINLAKFLASTAAVASRPAFMDGPIGPQTCSMEHAFPESTIQAVNLSGRMLRVANAKVDSERDVVARRGSISVYSPSFELEKRDILQQCEENQELQDVCALFQKVMQESSVFPDECLEWSEFNNIGCVEDPHSRNIQYLGSKVAHNLRDLGMDASIALDSRFSKHGVVVVKNTDEFIEPYCCTMMSAKDYNKRVEFINDKVEVNPRFEHPSFKDFSDRIPINEYMDLANQRFTGRSSFYSNSDAYSKSTDGSRLLYAMQSLVARISTIKDGFSFLQRAILTETNKLPILQYSYEWTAHTGLDSPKIVTVGLATIGITYLIHELFHIMDINQEKKMSAFSSNIMESVFYDWREYRAVAATNYFREQALLKPRESYSVHYDRAEHANPLPEEFRTHGAILAKDPSAQITISDELVDHYRNHPIIIESNKAMQSIKKRLEEFEERKAEVLAEIAEIKDASYIDADQKLELIDSLQETFKYYEDEKPRLEAIIQEYEFMDRE